MNNLWLIGMMGAGKTTVGERVAAQRGVPFIDVDRMVEARTGRSVSEAFNRYGDEAFRRLESSEIRRLATGTTGHVEGRVIATGGGAVLDDRSVAAMRRTGVVVWLDAPPASLAHRVGEERPLLAGSDVGDRLSAILDRRRRRYEGAAHFTLDARLAPAEVARQALRHARIAVGGSSEILIGSDLPERLLPDSPEREQAVVITQPGASGVARRVLERLEAETRPTLIEVPDREGAKTLETLGALYARLAELNLGRHDTVVGVGGGATTDVAGFTAATWLRGIECVLVPTTLLGAVDASIGGKTGINVMGKNLVGAFWHPARVAVSLDVLSALPEELLREGSAEAIKAGFIADTRLVELFVAHGLSFPMAEVVRRAVAVKAAVVSGDFRETGHRAILNFGHTIGHGIEVVCGLPHGHAVSVGMVAAGAVSAARFGFDPAIVDESLERLGLPTRADGADASEVRRLIYRDKKRTRGGLRMVLLRDLADPVVEPVDETDVSLAMSAVGLYNL